MKDNEGIYCTQYIDGYYWCEEDGQPNLIEIMDDQVSITGSEEWTDVGDYKGQIIEEIIPPIL